MFWILALLMVLAALAFVLPPLLRGTAADPRRAALLQAHRSGVIDADEYAAKLATLPPSTSAPRSPRGLVIAIALLLPFAAVLAYSAIGEPRALDPAQTAAVPAPADSAPAPNMDAAVAGLAQRLQDNPDDLDGWVLLGRAYKSMERFEPARDAFANARRLAPDDADLTIEYAEAMVLASDSHRFEGEALQLLQQALEREPDSQRGLWLLGVASYQKDDFASAAQTWERLVAAMPADAPARAALVERVADARSRAGLPTLAQDAPASPTSTTPNAATASPTGPAATGTARLTVTVDITPELKAKLAPTDVLFIFARAATGPRMPLAIQRLPASALPTTVTLDDSTSMMPSMTLSSQPQVVVGARVSKAGDATAKSGDFETLSAPLSNTQATPVTLTIDRVVP